MPREENGMLVYELDELRKMDKKVVAELMAKAARIEGTALVRKADGSIKYDDPSLKGSYHEPEGVGQ
jgi:hypothetical protein